VAASAKQKVLASLGKSTIIHSIIVSAIKLKSETFNKRSLTVNNGFMLHLSQQPLTQPLA
jgi:hypothetical protein